MIFLQCFYGHVYFIEDNERFKLGGEDLEKVKIFKQISKFSKFFNFFTILKLLFFKFLLLLTP